MMVFAIRIKHPLDVAVQCLHDADARHHRRAAVASATRIKTSTAVCHSSICCSSFGSFLDIAGSVIESDKLATAGQRDQFVERPAPAPRPITKAPVQSVLIPRRERQRNGPSGTVVLRPLVSEHPTGGASGKGSASRGSCTRVSKTKLPARESFRPNLKY
jgi:hypothetical protein